jgi:hypothetical protein
MTSPLAGALEAARRELELDWASEEQRQIELTQAEKYARDPVGWINSGHVWIASPFGPETKIPTTVHGWLRFKRRLRPVRVQLFPDQVKTIAGWIDLEHLAATGELVFTNEAAEKSRQIGETWLYALVMCWAVHYHRVTGLAMHVDGGEIDDGGSRSTVRSLFGKIRYIDQRLDRAKLPGLGRLVFRPFSRDPAKVENLDNGAVIYGEGQTDDPGRGGTFDFVLVDEAPFVRHGEKVYAAIDEACPNGKALLGTVNGDSNFHARICDEKPAGYTVLRLHWSEHPIYRKGLHVAGRLPGEQPDEEQAANADGCDLCAGNIAGVAWDPTDPAAHRYPGRLTSPWYDWRVIGKTDEQVANELDIDRARALADRVYPEFQTERLVVDDGIPYDPEIHHHLELAIDYGLDATSVLVFQDAPAELRLIGILEMGHLFGSSGTPDKVCEALRDYLRDLGVEEMRLAFEWTRRIFGVGDPAGHARGLESGKPLVNAYRRHGFYFTKPPSRLTRTISASIVAAKQLMLGHPKPLRVCGVKADAFAAHARNNTWNIGSDGRVIGLRDDVHNHAMRAFAYYAVAKFPPPKDKEPDAGEPFDEPGQRWRPLADSVRL